jgi:hypothetical protein
MAGRAGSGFSVKVEPGHVGEKRNIYTYAAGLGIKCANWKVTRVVEGQCKSQGVKEGDIIVGLDGRELAALNITLIAEFTAYIKKEGRSRIVMIHFNEMPAVKRDLLDDGFDKLIVKGLEVMMKAEGGCCSRSEKPMILYMDANQQSLICGRKKGEPTHFVYSVHSIKNVGTTDVPLQVSISTLENTHLVIKLPSQKSADLLVNKLHQTVKREQDRHTKANVIHPVPQKVHY